MSETTTNRYTVSRGVDAMGNRYATGPLVFLETDSLEQAQAYVFANGGELSDHTEQKMWCPQLGWYDMPEPGTR